MKNRILVFITTLVILLLFTVPTLAASARLVDDADLLSDTEESTLLSELDRVSENLEFDIVIVTTDDTNGLTTEAYADDFFDYNGYGYGADRDGILLVIDMNAREAWMSTSGYGITAFTDAGIEYISEQFKDMLSDGDYNGACTLFVEKCEDFINQARTGKPYDKDSLPKEPFNFAMSFVIAIGIGLVFGWIMVGSMKSKLKTVVKQHAATNYMRPGSMNLVNSMDYFIYSKLDRYEKSSNSSGGSSTHKSSSGRTHGGGGTSF